MRNDKFRAYKLRVGGKSYNEISKILGTPKSTLSGWFTSLILPQEAQDRLKKRVYEKSIKALIKRNKFQTHLAEKRARQIRQTSKTELGRINKRDLFILGVALYWAEGYKRPRLLNGKIRTCHPVSLTNSDPRLIVSFLKFLRETCNVPENKIRAGLRIFDHQNENYLTDFWQRTTQIDSSRFGKIYKAVSISSQRKKPFNTLPYGTIQIKVSDTNLYHKVMGWIDGLSF
ncbi:MAG: hypothetical protein A3B91_05070 [Candidatus Yanofskybacteria bacterium RIFCSPHIGHO2_02_FULL_41_29]|uniref:Uncharacterized protein n=1 Tax=Candidatus Yanofskybacteria bacterium RIFCSPHIGHO2_01_FULL_41_53 TaxID=1802663 RepID=A0A1F8EIM7_9BACT|nr:MAG: hypothetical protein A2650_04070 [Candidatus Yanofskybacteria bacterium RIFCSPHIGHO2_01_FULL_41_53]OGN11666.1 MAG: hypothetical protein A3B91_05070 [Candidatus Yanofskybacteria bacterium RIFCSPHIGHO2_02_FULL_41_29]OGN17901.1 MAG: hypothetical protein A3F48_02000 [Candidatus Yanofskybacteria bacterium RIFCSPHIGHO2_12_FULL_41_9]OGN23426.1 MAG: hypothetical protein A2916_03460 [Candidatus Yanofskybacteria bacterium RIFCSPLOWO2_01_FULL_41_67]OGN30304.1 MAG: hypothetical protein A3H54_04450 